MIHCQAIYPSWLGIGDLEIGAALTEIGFCYAGLAKEFHIEVDRHLLAIGNWDFYSSKNEILLDAVCQQALYFYQLDLNEKTAAEVVKSAKFAIASLAKQKPSEEGLRRNNRLFEGVLENRSKSIELDLNVVPISLEGLVLSVLGIEDNSGVFRLKREIQLQEELLLFERKKSPEYREILANLDELMRQFWGVSDLN